MTIGRGYMPNKQERELLKQHHLVRAPHNKQIARIAWHFGAWERASVAIVALRRPGAGLKPEMFSAPSYTRGPPSPAVGSRSSRR